MHRAINGYFFTAAVTTKFEYGETVRNSESLKMGLCFRNDRKSLKSDLQLPSKLIDFYPLFQISFNTDQEKSSLK